jgi:hypothetical protein
MITMKATRQSDNTETVILADGEGRNFVLEANAEPSKQPETDDRIIYSEADMPALEEMLSRLNLQTAIFEKTGKPAPEIAGSATTTPAAVPGPRQRTSASGANQFRRTLVLGGFPTLMLTAGVVMLIGAFAGGRAVTNPYLGLAFLLMGITLGATSFVALSEASRRA